MNNILYLREMGLDFWSDDAIMSDMKNYRVRTLGECIPGKDGRMYFLEFSLWRDRKKARYTHKVTSKPLKHPVYEIINRQGVAIDTEFSNDGGSWRNWKLEEELNTKNYSYTQHDILEIVNTISTNHYDQILFVD